MAKAIKQLLVVDFDGKKVGSWMYKNELEYKKAVKDGNYDTVKNVVLVDITVTDGVLVVTPR